MVYDDPGLTLTYFFITFYGNFSSYDIVRHGKLLPWGLFEDLDTFQYYKYKSSFHVGKVKMFSFIK